MDLSKFDLQSMNFDVIRTKDMQHLLLAPDKGGGGGGGWIWKISHYENTHTYSNIQSTLVISTLLISNNRLSQSKNLVPVLIYL